MVCAQKGYPLVVTMAENFSVERRKLMRFPGARVVLTPASEKGTGMLNKAVELAETHGWFLCRQFEKVAEDAEPGSTTLCMLPDTGERYLSTPLFAGVPVEMTDEEIEISRSTPRYRFDAPPAAAPAASARPEPPPEPTPAAAAFVAETVSEPSAPVVMFAPEMRPPRRPDAGNSTASCLH